ncbi:MAG TPA: hypothetical protein VGP92_02065 [Acidimicrobiia bacterium]|nr:hypothetical protein [Acidimicrobiia bacterium]
MKPENDPIPNDDAIADAMRAALTRTAAAEPRGSVVWANVMVRARRLVMIRRVFAASACAALVLGASAVAFASTSGGRGHGVSVSDDGSTTTVTLEPTTTSIGESTSTTVTSVPSTNLTAPVTTPASTTTTTALPPQPAEFGDFFGYISYWGYTCTKCPPGQSRQFNLDITNMVPYPIDLSPSAPVRVALVCSAHLTPDGLLTQPLPAGGPSTVVEFALDARGLPAGTKDILYPGEHAASTAAYVFVTNDPGPTTCEGAIVTSSDGSWNNETLTVVKRLVNTESRSFDVLPPSPTPAPSTTTTTIP